MDLDSHSITFVCRGLRAPQGDRRALSRASRGRPGFVVIHFPYLFEDFLLLRKDSRYHFYVLLEAIDSSSLRYNKVHVYVNCRPLIIQAPLSRYTLSQSWWHMSSSINSECGSSAFISRDRIIMLVGYRNGFLPSKREYLCTSSQRKSCQTGKKCWRLER